MVERNILFGQGSLGLAWLLYRRRDKSLLKCPEQKSHSCCFQTSFSFQELSGWNHKITFLAPFFWFRCTHDFQQIHFLAGIGLNPCVSWAIMGKSTRSEAIWTGKYPSKWETVLSLLSVFGLQMHGYMLFYLSGIIMGSSLYGKQTWSLNIAFQDEGSWGPNKVQGARSLKEWDEEASSYCRC